MKYRLLLGAIFALNIPVSGVFASQSENVLFNSNLDEPFVINDQQLDKYRGGFRLQDDYIVNIGLSITTAIDGNVMLNSQIANLVIENGSLKSQSLQASKEIADTKFVSKAEDNITKDVGLVNVIQVGSGNFIETSGGSPSYRQAVVSASSITNIVQNSLDNRSIGVNTVVDIDAQVTESLKQMRATKQLNEAVMSRFY